MRRPTHQPDYSDPPLVEVALSIQFTPVNEYKSVYSSDIWGLFKKDFPKIREVPLTESQFETFGGKNVQGFQFQVGAPPVGTRLWFISDDESHILQFQPDLLVTNWKKLRVADPYPRFEGIAESFEDNIGTLAKYFEFKFKCQIDINQAEVAYVNIIPVSDFSEFGKWFSLWNDDYLNIESLATNFNEVILDESNKPVARLKHEIHSVLTPDGKGKAFRLSLTYKGKPLENDIGSAMKFIAAGREAIVSRFDHITTDKAHQTWGKNNE